MNNRNKRPSTEVWEWGRLGKLLGIHVLRGGWRVQTGLARQEEALYIRPAGSALGVRGIVLLKVGACLRIAWEVCENTDS